MQDGFQESLFAAEDVMPQSATVGYRGTLAREAAGITYRQLDYWARTGLVHPSIQSAKGSGSVRLYSFDDILTLRIVRRLLDAGVSLRNVRAAIEHLRANDERIADRTLLSDGAQVFDVTSQADVIDLISGGQGVFGIAVGSVRAEVEGALVHFPHESQDHTTGVATPLVAQPLVNDELAARRSRRAG